LSNTSWKYLEFYRLSEVNNFKNVRDSSPNVFSIHHTACSLSQTRETRPSRLTEQNESGLRSCTWYMVEKGCEAIKPRCLQYHWENSRKKLHRLGGGQIVARQVGVLHTSLHQSLSMATKMCSQYLDSVEPLRFLTKLQYRNT
jgi:hypothetical protein